MYYRVQEFGLAPSALGIINLSFCHWNTSKTDSNPTCQASVCLVSLRANLQLLILASTFEILVKQTQLAHLSSVLKRLQSFHYIICYTRKMASDKGYLNENTVCVQFRQTQMFYANIFDYEFLYYFSEGYIILNKITTLCRRLPVYATTGKRATLYLPLISLDIC